MALWLRTLLAGLALSAVLVSPAGADAAGPSNYQSEIVSIDPALPGLDVTMIGGDSFISLEAPPWVEVVVIGYRGEPYVRFLPSGIVEENQLSPSKFLNEERFGETAIPTEATAEAEPVWKAVDDDGTWAWHDHRTHWMNRRPPPGAKRGDQIQEGVIPLFVDGQEVDVTVASYWLPAPSPIAVLVGGAVGLVVAGLGWVHPARRGWMILAPCLGLSFVVGVWQVLSLPPETGPSPLNWLLPLVGLLALAVLPLVQGTDRSKAQSQVVLATGLVLVGAVNLALWGLMRRAGLMAAILPTDAPAGLERISIAVAAIVGVGLSVHATRGLFSPERLGN